jgi:hypothetical protein
MPISDSLDERITDAASELLQDVFGKGCWKRPRLFDRIFPMSTVQLRQQAKAMIDELSTGQLRAASEFLAFVKSRELDSATLELLSIPGFEASFARGVKDVKAGRTKPWRKVRSDV